MWEVGWVGGGGMSDCVRAGGVVGYVGMCEGCG